MSKARLNVNESEKQRIINLHSKNSLINEQKMDVSSDEYSLDRFESETQNPKPKMMSAASDAGDYHMWQNCNGGAVVALFDNQVQTANGQSCHNAVNQGNPGLVLACNQALVTAFGTGPVLKWGIGNQQKSCWEYQGTQYYNSIPPISSPGQGGNFPTPQTLASCSQCSGQGDLAWMCTDVGGGVGGTGCQAVTCPYPTVQNMPGKCWDNQQDCNNGGLNPSLNAQPCGGYDPNTNHDCINGTCVQSWQGQYSSLASCQNQCGGSQGATHYCINCAQQVMSTYTSPGSCPQGFADLGTQMPQNGPCIECTNGNCVQTGQGWNGVHNSLSDCQAVCQQQPYECVNNSCVQQPGGSFPTIADCQNSGCGQQTNSYDCTSWTDPNGCQPVSGPGGQFATLDDCLTSPCQCDDIITVWPLYTNNPNIGSGSGSWYGSPHDGPSNNNAIQNQLNNLQGNPNFPGGNPVQQHKMKCREAAMIFWLAQNSNTCTICSDPGFAVGAATSDPLGCVAQQFINMMDNFMVQHSNWPNNGCNWLTNALTNAQNQQSQYNPGSNAYCKLQGKIDFLTNFINTTQSTYLTGTAVFTPGC